MSTIVGYQIHHFRGIPDVYCRKMSTVVDLEFHVST